MFRAKVLPIGNTFLNVLDFSGNGNCKSAFHPYFDEGLPLTRIYFRHFKNHRKKQSNITTA